MRSQTKKKVTSWLLLPQNINCYHCNKFIFVNWKSQKNLIELFIGGFPFNMERAFHSQWNLDETEEHHMLYVTFLLHVQLATIDKFGWLVLYIEEKERQ